MKTANFYVGTLIILLMPLFLFSQNQDTAEVRPIREVLLTATAVKAKIDSYSNDLPLNAIKKDLITKRFIEQTKPENYWGFQRVYKNGNDPEVTIDLILQDYKNTSQKQNAAMGKVIVKRGKEIKAYTFFLVATDNNVKEMKEYYVDDNNKIVPAHSWWSCVRRVSQRRCGGIVDTCEKLFSKKYGSIVAYVGCYGGCALGTMFCCTCDCTWWCSFVGCCHQ